MSDYLALGAFLAPPLAGAAFPVDPALVALPPLAPFLPPVAVSAPTLCAGGLACASLSGAGFAVGLPATSPAPSSGVSPPDFLPLSLAGAASVFGAAALASFGSF